MNKGIVGFGAKPVAYASLTEAQDSVSDIVPVNTVNMRDNSCAVLQITPTFQTGLVSPASTALWPFNVYMTTGASAGGTGQVSVIVPANGSAFFFFGPSAGNATGCDWSRPRFLEFRFVAMATSTNGVLRVMLGGKPWNWTIGAMTHHGIGLEVRNTRLWITAHNGTTGVSQDTGIDVVASSSQSTNHAATYRITSDGLGNVNLYRNGIQIGSTLQGGPRVNTNNACNIIYEVACGGDTTATTFQLSPAKILAS